MQGHLTWFGDERLPQRFWSKVEVDALGCWLWVAGKSSKGYGRFQWEGKTRNAHRIAYALLVEKVPSELHVDHLCRVRACVNPAHLEPVTCRINLLCGDTLQAANAAKTHCLRGHELAGDNLYATPGRRHCRLCRLISQEGGILVNGGENYVTRRELADLMGVSVPTVNRMPR